MHLNGNMATEVAKGAFLPVLKYGASSPTRCDVATVILYRRILIARSSKRRGFLNTELFVRLLQLCLVQFWLTRNTAAS